MMATMKAAKMNPWGIGGLDESPFIALESMVNAGVHSNTNTYMEPSKSDWIRPK